MTMIAIDLTRSLPSYPNGSSPPQRGLPRLPWWSFSQSFHRPQLNRTRLHSPGIAAQPDLPRPYWTGLSGRLAVIS
jgi:hypothetical protein